MLEGLWTAEFGTNTGMFGGGVAVFKDGKILGGDATHYYVGEYKQIGNRFVATLKIAAFIKGAQSVFQTVGRELTLELAGELTPEETIIAQGHIKEMNLPRFAAKLTKRS